MQSTCNPVLYTMHTHTQRMAAALKGKRAVARATGVPVSPSPSPASQPIRDLKAVALPTKAKGMFHVHHTVTAHITLPACTSHYPSTYTHTSHLPNHTHTPITLSNYTHTSHYPTTHTHITLPNHTHTHTPQVVRRLSTGLHSLPARPTTGSVVGDNAALLVLLGVVMGRGVQHTMGNNLGCCTNFTRGIQTP